MSEYTATPNSNGVYPTEAKTTAATTAATFVGFALTGLANGLRDSDVPALFAFLPDNVLGQILDALLVSATLGIPTFAAGWNAKHQKRVNRNANGL